MEKCRVVALTMMILIFGSLVRGQIISQYIETDAGTTPKGIEIWNNTDAVFDFATNNLVIKKGGNGNPPAADYTLAEGTLASGAVVVIGSSDLQTVTEINGSVFYLKPFTFNGDDALEVWYGDNKTDVFGMPGSDPGSAWSGNDVSTADQNIQIKSDIIAGDLDGWTDPSERFETVSTTPSGIDGMMGFGVSPSGGNTDPTIVLSVAVLSGFSYVVDNGPSAEQFFTVEGGNLVDDISITAPINYEISTTSGSGYLTPLTLVETDGVVDLTTVYVRLKAGLSEGSFNNEVIGLASDGADAKTVTCNGSVTDGGFIEDFTNSNASASYGNGSFVGNNGITWSYVASRNGNNDANSSGITLPALMLRDLSHFSSVSSSVISGGIANFSVKLYKGFTGVGNRQVELFINGESQGSSVEFDDLDEHLFSVSNINVEGDFTIALKNTAGKQIIVDDISWNGYIDGNIIGDCLPETTELFQNYPNPFNPETEITYNIAKGSDVKIAVFNYKGELVQELVNKFQPAGRYSVKWNGSNATSGIYFYKMSAGNYTKIMRAVMVK